jgi:hypothetical protein
VLSSELKIGGAEQLSLGRLARWLGHLGRDRLTGSDLTENPPAILKRQLNERLRPKRGGTTHSNKAKQPHNHHNGNRQRSCCEPDPWLTMGNKA